MKKTSAYDKYGRRKYLNNEENQRFLRAILSLPEDQQALCQLLYFTGCRPTEARNLRAGDCEPQNSVIIINSLKKRNRIERRRLLVPPDLKEYLIKRMKTLDPESRIWPISKSTAWRIVHRAMQLAEIQGIQASAKGLRHGFGVRCALRKIPVSLISKHLGHSSLETTSIYLDVRDEEELELISKTWV